MLPQVRAAKDAMGWEARAGYHGHPLEGPLKVSVDLYWGDNRKHDVDNIKALLDALTGIVWEDDGQITDLHTKKFYDPTAPRVELSIEEGANLPPTLQSGIKPLVPVQKKSKVRRLRV